jgi:hypothetical protein
MDYCRYTDLDAAAGVCRRCGAAFHAEPDPTVAVEAHYEPGAARARRPALAGVQDCSWCGHSWARHGRYGCDTGLCRCQGGPRED